MDGLRRCGEQYLPNPQVVDQLVIGIHDIDDVERLTVLTVLADVIEDVLPLHDVTLSVRAAHRPTAVLLLPDAQPVAWEWQDGYARLTLPRVDGYALVQLVAAE